MHFEILTWFKVVISSATYNVFTGSLTYKAQSVLFLMTSVLDLYLSAPLGQCWFLTILFSLNVTGKKWGKSGKMSVTGFIPLKRLNLNSKCQRQYESHQFGVTKGHQLVTFQGLLCFIPYLCYDTRRTRFWHQVGSFTKPSWLNGPPSWVIFFLCH